MPTPQLPRSVADAIADLPPLVPALAAAEFLHVSTRTLRTWSRSGRIRTLKTSEGGSGRVLVARDEIARMIASMANRDLDGE